MITIARLTADEFSAALDEFAHLLIDAVESGGSVSFVAPLSVDRARAYWHEIGTTIASGQRLAWAAWDDDLPVGARLVGCVLLEFSTTDNGRHRAEVQKMLVHRAYRGLGIAKRLMATMEDAARAAGLKLLVLDTEKGGNGEQLYERIGYQRAGEIPQFARMGDGSLIATVFFYRLL